MKQSKFIFMALVMVGASAAAEEPQLTPPQIKALKQAHADVEQLTPQARADMLFTAESIQCITTAQAYFELVKDVPEGAFIQLSTKYCFHGGTAAHERNKNAINSAFKDISKENVSENVKSLLRYSFMRGAAIGHQLELDAIQERFLQLTLPDAASHDYFK